jgi:CheY-like chemotaxis protein
MSENQDKSGLLQNGKPSSKLIMVIDNSEDILHLFDLLLTGAGYRVSLHFAYNKRDLQEIKRLMPDLIISDLDLNDQTAGWQFLETLKMDQQTQNIPVIVCSALVDTVKDTNERLVKLGMRRIPKPFRISKLLSLVRELLD